MGEITMSEVLFYSISGILGIAFLVTLFILYRTLSRLSRVREGSHLRAISLETVIESRDLEIKDLKEKNETLKEELEGLKAKKKRNTARKKKSETTPEGQMNIFELELQPTLVENDKIEVEFEDKDEPFNPVISTKLAQSLSNTLLLKDTEVPKVEVDSKKEYHPVGILPSSKSYDNDSLTDSSSSYSSTSSDF
jgi:hypothetical protein